MTGFTTQPSESPSATLSVSCCCSPPVYYGYRQPWQRQLSGRDSTQWVRFLNILGSCGHWGFSETVEVEEFACVGIYIFEPILT